MATVIDYRDMPKLMQVSAKGIKKAGVNTLNKVAFSTLPKLVSQADSDMNFSRNARRALGWRVEKASVASMHATVSTNRGWFGLHSKEGSRRPSSSRIVVNGVQMLFIPRAKGEGLVDKRGRIRKSASAGLFFIPKGDYALVMYRQRRNKSETTLLGVAVREAKFHTDTDWQAVIEKEWQATSHAIMKRMLDTRLAFERGKGN